MYFEEKMPTHAGSINESKVISKWGRGHIYQHDQLEVPSSYGNDIRFYRKPPGSMVAMRFVRYVQNHPDYSLIQKEFEEKFGHIFNR